MDFRRRKLYLAITIVISGMAIALAWCAWQGWVLGKGYPYNTFLFNPTARFSDLIEVLRCSASPTPYQHGSYFPSTYVAFRFFLDWPPLLMILFYLSVCSFGLWILSAVAIYPVVINPARLLFSWAVLVIASTALTFAYPLLIGIDRGNIEILLALLVSLALLCFLGRFNRLGVVLLFPAICFKLYPILILTLFMRPRHVLMCLLVVLAFLAVSVLSLASFDPSIQTSIEFCRQNMRQMNTTYVIHFWGSAGTASLWNSGKALLKTFYFLSGNVPSGGTVILEDSFLYPLYSLYSYVMLMLVAFTIITSAFVERIFFRRAVALLILLALVVPSGGDYRLIYANIALVVFIILPWKRTYDWLVLVLLSIVIIPKREILLSFVGKSDSGFADVPIAILINSPFLLIALLLLLSDGWRSSSWKFAQTRIWCLFSYCLHWRACKEPSTLHSASAA